jgi:hypothetical protein
MGKDIFIIAHSEFGMEEFEIKNARYNICEAEENIWEFTLSFDTQAALKRADKLEAIIEAKPNFEATAILASNELDLWEGRIILQEEGYDEEREEILSNIYYFSHESVDDLRIEILAVNKDEILVNLSGKGIVNRSNGNEPDAIFTLNAVKFIQDKKLTRGVM